MKLVRVRKKKNIGKETRELHRSKVQPKSSKQKSNYYQASRSPPDGKKKKPGGKDTSIQDAFLWEGSERGGALERGGREKENHTVQDWAVKKEDTCLKKTRWGDKNWEKGTGQRSYTMQQYVCRNENPLPRKALRGTGKEKFREKITSRYQ